MGVLFCDNNVRPKVDTYENGGCVFLYNYFFKWVQNRCTILIRWWLLLGTSRLLHEYFEPNISIITSFIGQNRNIFCFFPIFFMRLVEFNKFLLEIEKICKDIWILHKKCLNVICKNNRIRVLVGVKLNKLKFEGKARENP